MAASKAQALFVLTIVAFLGTAFLMLHQYQSETIVPYRDVSRKMLSLEDLVLRNQRRSERALSHVQQLVINSVKRIFPAGESEFNNDTLTRQQNRRQKIQKVCQEYAGFSHDRGADTAYSYAGRSRVYAQTIDPHAYLISHTPPAIICYNHKVASSTWMALFTKLYGDSELYESLAETGKFYTIWEKMAPKSPQHLFETLATGNYFSFTVVRHPFDRLLSAYRDRILNGCTGQSKNYVPRILHLTRKTSSALGNAYMYDRNTGCIKVFPDFNEFVQYVIEKPADHELHWLSFAKHCAPCLVDYDAIIKLETASDDEKYVLEQSGISQYADLVNRHDATAGGHAEAVRSRFYSNVTCDQINRLEEVYKMDLEMFDYETKLFHELCMN